MNAKKVIIDCDPGIDDALALLLALHAPELEILGITIVCGNVPTTQGAENALKVLQFANRLDIPVYLGEAKPLQRDYVDAMDTHGSDGLGETYLPNVTQTRPHKDAISFLAKTLSQQTKVSIIALGPLTNIARLLQKYPNCLTGLDEFVTMGGNFKSHGNCSPVAEYNYWCDPDAAKEVYEAFTYNPLLKQKQIHMIGLDVTRKIVLTPNLITYMKFLSPRIGNFIQTITQFYIDFHWKQEGILGCVINDPLAVAYFIDRSLCHGFSDYTTIETEGICIGQTVVDAYDFWKKEKNSYILTQTDIFRFMEFFITKVVAVPSDTTRQMLQQILVVHTDAPLPQISQPCFSSVQTCERGVVL